MAAGGDFSKLCLGFVELGIAHEQRTVSALDCSDAAGIEAMPLQALGIDPARARIFFLRHHQIRRHIAVDERPHADKRKITDAAELMHAGEATEDDVIAHRHMPRQRGVVGEHTAIAHAAIVRDMAVRQNPIAATHAGAAATVAGATVDGDKLANGIAITNLKRHALATVFLVLWLATDGGVRMQDVVAANPGGAFDGAMRADAGVVTDDNFGPDHRIRTYLHARPQYRRRVDHRSGVDRRRGAVHSRAAAAHRISAQATCCPSTRATPTYCAMLRMRRLSSTSNSRRSPGTTIRLNLALSTFTR